MIEGSLITEFLDKIVPGVPMRPTRLKEIVVSGLVLFALYFPTSIGGVISQTLSVVPFVVLCSVFLFLLLQRRGLGPRLLVLNSLLSMLLLMFSTLMSPFTEYSWGAVVVYLSLVLLYCVNLKDVPLARVMEFLFIAVNLVNIALAVGIVLNVSLVDQFIKENYSAFFPQLVEFMIDWYNKPIITFGSHSVAGFFFYLFFYLNYKAYVMKKSRWHLFLAITYVGLEVFVQSSTAFVFTALAVMQLLRLFLLRNRQAVPLVTLGILAFLILIFLKDVNIPNIAAALTKAAIGDEEGGLLARYSSGGILAGTINYILGHPLSPIGFSYSEELFYGDSGFVVYLLRGSLPLLLTVYGGLFIFLKANLKSKTTALFSFLVIIAFEIGFTPLLYFRFLGFLPFMIVYLNGLALAKPVSLAQPMVTVEVSTVQSMLPS